MTFHKNSSSFFLIVLGTIAAFVTLGGVRARSQPPSSQPPSASPTQSAVPSTDAESAIEGNVVRILDGDTLEVLVDRKPVRVRLHGIDAPEARQDYSRQAKDALGSLVFRKRVRVAPKDTDRYGRTVGIVYLGNTDINKSMLSLGWAWHYKKYDDSPSYSAAERYARSKRIGLWAGSNIIPPWDYRAGKRTPTENVVEPEKVEKQSQPVGIYWLNASTNVRHNSGCRYYGRTKRGRRCGPNEGSACGICGG